jgi:glycosyltransferase involved in cell wall biosynthesis
MKIGIIGTRGIPNNYGGFEQVTEHLSAGLLAKGHEVSVYNSHNHPYQENHWNGVEIIHCFDAEYIIGTAGQFIYDLNCIVDARKRNFDVLLFMGYTSSSIWHRFFPRNTVIVSNMDGLEWRRSKYSRPVKRFLKYAEKLAVLQSDFMIVDSSEIQDYYKNKYNCLPEYIPYGASLCREEKKAIFTQYNIEPEKYFLLMARMEPENNIEMILDGFQKSSSIHSFLVIGNTENTYGRYIAKKFSRDPRIIFLGSLFDQDAVHTLRKYSRLYFHGHSVGGTNPSLLEAMASRVMIAANNNLFNRAILKDDAYYFSNVNDVTILIEQSVSLLDESCIQNNYQKISEHFNWEKIVEMYHEFLSASYHSAFPVNKISAEVFV